MTETKYITLKNNPALTELSDYVGRSAYELRSDIITALFSYGYLTDKRMYCGVSLENILEQHHETVEGFARHCFHCSYERLQGILKGVIIWGIHHDCPYCGCETFIESREKVCINSGCNFSVGIYPEKRRISEEFLINLN